MFDLTGMTALVTGASGGIGSAIAQALAAQGARLAVSGSNADKLNAFRDSLGGDHVALPCNLGDAAAVDALVPSAVEALGQLDILVNNAGVSIISITSVVGATGNPGQANYAASKAGVTGMTKALAQELASRGVTANCVAPGFIATAMTDDLPDAQKEALNQRIPAGRMGEGSDIAAAVVYLASREAGYVTGQTIHVNGGMAMLS